MPTTRRDIPVFRIGDIEPFFLIHQDAFATIRWWEKQITIAYYFQCEPDDVGSHELDGGEEVIIVCGNVVGSFDRPVELKQLLTESAK